MTQVGDVVKIRSGYQNLKEAFWRVEKIVPSLTQGIDLHRVQRLKKDGTPHKLHQPISVRTNDILENHGRYEEWHKQLNNA